jgi:hypothetical protein
VQDVSAIPHRSERVYEVGNQPRFTEKTSTSMRASQNPGIE